MTNRWLTDEPNEPVLRKLDMPGCIIPRKMDSGNVFTQETIEHAIALVSEGWTLTKLCEEKPEMPSLSVLMQWIRDDEHYKALYASAIKARSHIYADQIVDIADSADSDQGGFPVDPATLKLKIDARKWVASNQNPEDYGTRHNTVDVNVNLSRAIEESERQLTVLNGEFQKLPSSDS
ncbi:MAG: hypothetical protein N0E48_16020 [Candidatus Thiodiazotropha endolucinida]|nr:hypothetical protein [Candidatus Thiodiazotropha taylori]MCW4344838.1 hypothetical protein [Candidatus Thiodiazotropha endolucinida]